MTGWASAISDAVNRPAPRLFSAIDELARQLHPEVFNEKNEVSRVSAPVEKN